MTYNTGIIIISFSSLEYNRGKNWAIRAHFLVVKKTADIGWKFGKTNQLNVLAALVLVQQSD